MAEEPQKPGKVTHGIRQRQPNSTSSRAFDRGRENIRGRCAFLRLRNCSGHKSHDSADSAALPCSFLDWSLEFERLSAGCHSSRSVKSGQGPFADFPSIKISPRSVLNPFCCKSRLLPPSPRKSLVTCHDATGPCRLLLRSHLCSVAVLRLAAAL